MLNEEMALDIAGHRTIFDEEQPAQFRARFLIQIGEPTNPNAWRIWFSRKRW
jgi:hypothetical protein